MRILGIDPGNVNSAAVLYDPETRAIEWKFMGSNEEMLEEFVGGFKDTIPVIEQVKSYGMAVGESVFETVFWSGRFAQALDARHSWQRLPRLAVKISICHDSRAKDANIRQALIDMFPATGGGKVPQIGTKKQPGPLYGFSKDLWAALAVAVAYNRIHRY